MFSVDLQSIEQNSDCPFLIQSQYNTLAQLWFIASDERINCDLLPLNLILSQPYYYLWEWLDGGKVAAGIYNRKVRFLEAWLSSIDFDTIFANNDSCKFISARKVLLNMVCSKAVFLKLAGLILNLHYWTI